jgi:hypothetical protein
MKKNTTLLAVTALFYFSLFFSGCNPTSDTEGVPIINIKDKNILRGTKLSELITDIKFVPLETTSECLIGELNKIDFSNNEIVVLDSRMAMAVYRFSEDGKFMNRIGQRGGGPEEYFAAEDISINPNNTNEIAILDQKGEILIYKTDNTYLRRIKSPRHARKIGWYDNRIAVYKVSEENLALIDEKEGTQINVFLKEDEAKRMILHYSFQLYQNKELLYVANLDYTIYKISGDRVYPHIRFTFDKPMYTDKNIGLLRDDINNMNKFVSFRYYNENPTHICMAYTYEGKPYMVIYDKSKSKTTTIDLEEIQNDITFMKYPPLTVTVDPNGYFVAQFDYGEVSNPDQLKKKMGRSADNLDEMSNPILMFFKFK